MSDYFDQGSRFAVLGSRLIAAILVCATLGSATSWSQNAGGEEAAPAAAAAKPEKSGAADDDLLDLLAPLWGIFAKQAGPVATLTAQCTAPCADTATIALTATATSRYSTVASVEFFAAGVSLGTKPSAPFTWTMSNVGPGAHALSAIATDIRGKKGAPASASVTVRANAAPSVTSLAVQCSPVTCNYPASTITLTATAADIDGDGIARVDFYDVSLGLSLANKIGSATGPYTFSFNPPVGSYKYRAVAVDGIGKASTLAASAEVSVQVNNTPPVVSGLSASCGGACFAATGGTNQVQLAANVADASPGSQVTLYFYRNGQPTPVAQCTVSGASCSTSWAAPVGTHAFTADAVDGYGGRSSPVGPANVTVQANNPPTISSVTPAQAQIALGGSVTYTVVANDPEAQGLTVRLRNGSTPLATGVATGAANTYSITWTPSTAGTYTLQVRATDADGLATDSAALPLTVTGAPASATPNATVANVPDPYVTPNVGTLAGSFAVTDSGAATYSIPIQVPPGTAGLQPNLSLNYSSQGGYGHLGVGWTLSGLSTITRCAKTEAQDKAFKASINYDGDPNNDAYCLDGQRLVRVGTFGTGVEYRTEVESYSRIVAYSETGDLRGPNRFRVWTKTGQIMDFGSRWWAVSAGWYQGPGYNGSEQPRYNMAKYWLLDRVEDRFGNFMEVDYTDLLRSDFPSEPGKWIGLRDTALPCALDIGLDSPDERRIGAFPSIEVWPVAIRYYQKGASPRACGGSAYNQVRFVYEDIPGETLEAQQTRNRYYDPGAGQSSLTKRLLAIETYIDSVDNQVGTLVKRYLLTYEQSKQTNRSLLKYVTECAPNYVCLPSTVFDWQSRTSQGPADGFSSTWTPLTLPFSANTEVQLADFDGDGRTDLLGWERTLIVGSDPEAFNLFLHVCYSTGVGFNCQRTPTELRGAPGGYGPPLVELLDLNGDGRVDYFSPGYFLNGNPFPPAVCLAVPGGFNCGQSYGNTLPYPVNSTEQAAYRGDFDGDGRIDYFFYTGDLTYRVCLTQENQFLCTSTLNYLESVPHPNCQLTGDPATGCEDLAGNAFKDNVLIADVNGDGKADLLIRRGTADGWRQQWKVCFSDFAPGLASEGGATNRLRCNDRFVKGPERAPHSTAVFDFNGDGLADLASHIYTPTNIFAYSWNVCLSTGDGAFEFMDIGISWDPLRNEFRGAAGAYVDYYNAFRCRVWSGLWVNEDDPPLFGDFNGDGRTDMAMITPTGSWQVCLSTGVAFNCAEAPGPAPRSYAPQVNQALMAGDFDGDGQTDVFWWNAWQADPAFALSKAPRGSDIVTKVTTGLGATTKVQYVPLSDPIADGHPIYRRGDDSDRSSRELNIQSPMFVVSKVEASDGIGGWLPSAYYYEGLRGRTDGREMYGFAKHRVRDGNGIVTEVQYTRVASSLYPSQWPVVGRPAKVLKYAPSAIGLLAGIPPSDDPALNGANFRLVSSATSTWETRPSRTCVDAYNNQKTCGGQPAVLEAFLTYGSEEHWELDGGNLPSSTASTQLANYDAYGNVLATSTSTADGFGKTTANTYSNDNANWVLGRLITSSVTSSSPAGNSTRSVSFVYHGLGDYCGGILGSLCKEIVEPDYAPGKPAASINPYLWQQTRYNYDGFGNRIKTTISFVDRAPTGDVLADRASNVSYDARGRFPVSLSNALRQTETRIYDARFGGILSQTDPNGLITERKFDDFGRTYLATTRDAENHRLSQTYSTVQWVDPANGLTQGITRSSTGAETRTSYDSLQRETKVESKAFSANTWASASTTYDHYGRKLSVTKPAGSGTVTVSTGYDVLNRPVSVVQKENSSVNPITLSSSLVFGVLQEGSTYRGKLTSTVSGTGIASRSTEKLTNSQGQTLKVTDKVTDAATVSTTFTYDAQGNLTKVTGPTGIQEEMSYDLRGRKLTLSNPDSGLWSYAYNGVGELVQQADARSLVTEQFYDKLGRILERREGQASGLSFVTVWSYDSYADGSACAMGVGNLCETRSGYPTRTRGATLGGALDVVDAVPSVRVLSTYDVWGRPVESLTEVREGSTNSLLPTVKSFASATAYDAESRVASITYPSGFGLQRSYGAWSGAMTEVKDSNGQVHWAAGSRNLDGQIGNMTLGGAVSVSKSYDGFGRVASINAAAGTLQNASFSFDALGNLKSRRDDVNGQASQSFGYDALNRLVTQNGAVVASYDDAGNILTRSDFSGNYSYFPGSHRLSSAGGYGLSYDANGNVQTVGGNGANKLIDYLSFNLPATISSEGNNLSYLYDAAHARIKERVTNGGGSQTSLTWYLGSFEEHQRADNVIEQRHYINTPEGAVGIVTWRSNGINDSRYWLKDHLGSIVAITDAAGSAKARYRYDAWGKRIATTPGEGEERGFTGHEHLVEAGLIHMNGRLYFDPLGRMLQADPVIQDPQNGQNYNRYSYVLNNPLSLTDPTGYKHRLVRAAWLEAASRGDFLGTHLVRRHGVRLSQDPDVRFVGAMIAAYFTGGAAYASAINAGASAYGATVIAGTAAGFAAGGIQGGNLESAMRGALSGGVGSAVFGVSTLFAPEPTAAVAGSVPAPIVKDEGRVIWGSPAETQYPYEPVVVAANGPMTNLIKFRPLEVKSVMEGCCLITDTFVPGAQAIQPVYPEVILPIIGAIGRTVAATGRTAFFRGAKPGEAPSFAPRPGEFKVDPETGFVKDTRGVSVFDNPLSVSSKGWVPHRVDQSSIPDSLRIIRRGSDPSHFEIVPMPGANLTPQQFINACRSIVCVK